MELVCLGARLSLQLLTYYCRCHFCHQRHMVVPTSLHQGFDLLDPSHETKKLEDLPKVTLMEDEGGNIHLR